MITGQHKVVAEIGVNHGGDLDRALRLIRMAAESGAAYVKFQKRTPELSTPKSMWDTPKVTPWGTVERYIDYRIRAEFGQKEFDRIDQECADYGIGWFASAWDKPSVDFLSQYQTDYLKIPSALATDHALLEYASANARNLVVSTGMCTWDEVQDIAQILTLRQWDDILMVCHSSYPVENEAEINLAQIESYREAFSGLWIGFSSHADSPYPAIYSAVLDAKMIEVHITENRSWTWGDNSASLERPGLELLCREVNRIERIMGDGIKRLYPSELKAKLKLRGE